MQIQNMQDGLKAISDKIVVSETVFEENKWFIMEVEAEIYEIDSSFSSFYEEASKKGLLLKSKHMIKVSEDSISIVARVEDSN